jgi:hypothetical protein
MSIDKLNWQPEPEEKDRAIANLGLLPWQAHVYLHPARYRVVSAGRRSGKSFLCMHELYRAANSVEKGLVVYIAPTLKMAKQIMWRQLLDMIPPEVISEINRTDMSLVLKRTGTMIRLFGAEVPDRLRGLSISFAVFDEAADIDEAMWSKIVRPALADQQGDALFLGTPKVSAGSKWYYELYCQGLDPGKKGIYGFTITTAKAGIVPESEVNEARQSMDKHTFAAEFEACHLSCTKVPLFGGGFKPISEIEVGNKVCHLTDAGDVVPVEVKAVGKTGYKQIALITLETGETFRASVKHKMKVGV